MVCFSFLIGIVSYSREYTHLLFLSAEVAHRMTSVLPGGWCLLDLTPQRLAEEDKGFPRSDGISQQILWGVIPILSPRDQIPGLEAGQPVSIV